MEWVTSVDPVSECWFRLMEFASHEHTMGELIKRHGPIENGKKKNYEKQVRQVRYCLQQAREYFEAASHASFLTKPNHLYYGIVCLASACMLIRGGCGNALDFLRKDKSNQHHGLIFNTNSGNSREGVSLLENSFVRTEKNGFFCNWYKTLSSKGNVDAVVINRQKNGGYTKDCESIGFNTYADFELLVGNNESLLSLIKRLPDLAPDLYRFNIDLDFAYGHQEITFTADAEREDKFFFHTSTSNLSLMRIIDKFKCEHAGYFCIDIHEGNNFGSIWLTSDKPGGYSSPDCRTTINNRVIYYPDDFKTAEVVDLMKVSYALSMLSRYYPDIWIAFNESHCIGSSLLERVIQLLSIKVPLLMLNEIIGKNQVISINRPFWHD